MNRVYLLAPVLLVLASCTASQPRLTIGDPAPPLTVSNWVKGDPVEVRQVAAQQTPEQDVVVLEFWATWCGPCVGAIPHVTKLQQLYSDKGVRIVGVSAFDEGNTLKMVEDFVKKQGDKMGYGIAFDKEKTTYQAYMKAARQNGIPTSFIVDRSGRLAWIGHPMSMDKPLEKIVSGQFDIEIAKQTFTIKEDINQAYMKMRWGKVLRHADRWIEIDPQDPSPWMTKFRVHDRQLSEPTKAIASAKKAIALMGDDHEQLSKVATSLIRKEDLLGFNPLAQQAIERAVAADPNSAEVRLAQYRVLSTLEKDEQAQVAVQKAIELSSDDTSMLGRLASMLANPESPSGCHDLALTAIEKAIAAEPEELRYLQTKFDILVNCLNDLHAAETVGRYLVEQAAEEDGLLNNFAWGLLTDEPCKGKFNTLALLAAEKCHQASGGENFMYLDTYSLAKFENGLVDEAIKLQKQAIELCPKDFSGMAEFKERLELYEKSKK